MRTPGGPALLLDASAGGENRLARFRAHLETAHRHRTRDGAVREHFHGPARLHEPRRAQRVARHLAVDRRKLIETDDIRLLAERIRETALRQPARERHLAALELRLAATGTVMSRAGLDSLVALSRRLARSGARTASQTLAVAVAARGGQEVMRADLVL